MKLKCFGGPRDGEMIDIEHAQASIGNRIHAPLSPGILKWMEKWAASKVLFEFAAPVYGFYVVERFLDAGCGGEWLFLRYEQLRREQVFGAIFGSAAAASDVDMDILPYRPTDAERRAVALEIERRSIANGVRKYEG